MAEYFNPNVSHEEMATTVPFRNEDDFIRFCRFRCSEECEERTLERVAARLMTDFVLRIRLQAI